MPKKKKSSGSSSLFKLGSMRVSKSDLFETLGAGLGGTIGGVVNNFRPPGQKFSGNVAQAIGGLALAFFGGRKGAQIAKGVFQKTGGDFIEDWITKQNFLKQNNQVQATNQTQFQNLGGSQFPPIE